MKKKILVAALCIMLAAFPLTVSQASFKSIDDIPTNQVEAVKDETVFANLDAGGGIKEVNVVNRLESKGSGIYLDYGAYNSINNLTNGFLPQSRDGAIIWQLEQDSVIYYQGRLSSAQLPYLFNITYKLDGEPIAAADIAGKSGRVTIELAAEANDDCAEYFRKNYLCQIQASLDIDKCKNVTATQSSGVIVGKSLNIAYTLLPGSSSVFELTFETESMEFTGFTMTCMPFNQNNFTNIDTGSIKSGIDELSSGIDEMINGTSELKNGLEKMSKGMSSLSAGAKEGYNGAVQYKNGLSQYAATVEQLALSAQEIAANLKELADGGKGLADGFLLLQAEIESMLDQIYPVAGEEQKAQIDLLRIMLDAYYEDLSDYTDGISDIADGMIDFAQGVAQLGEEGSDLVPGLTLIIDGMKKLSDGLAKTAAEMKKIPGELNKMIDGQLQMKEGVDDAKEMLDTIISDGDLPAPVSFVSEKNSVRSVQFIYKTDEIKVSEQTKPIPGQQEESKNFFEKLLDLFR